jgi:hypothetical protein
VCLGCDLLFDSQRGDQLTCSAACRVRVHRNGRARRWFGDVLRAGIPKEEIDLAFSLEVKALRLLRSDLADRVRAERGFTAEQWRGDLWRAYWDVVIEAVEADQALLVEDAA